MVYVDRDSNKDADAHSNPHPDEYTDEHPYEYEYEFGDAIFNPHAYSDGHVIVHSNTISVRNICLDSDANRNPRGDRDGYARRSWFILCCESVERGVLSQPQHGWDGEPFL